MQGVGQEGGQVGPLSLDGQVGHRAAVWLVLPLA